MTYSNIRANYNDAFDRVRWDRIISTMVALDWRWYPKDVVPSISEMKHLVDDLFYKAYNSAIQNGNKETIASGGFIVTVDIEEESVEIIFAVEQHSAPNW